ncbi:DUF952 domain-containing protein [Fibrivirga algicola]|uniref:DUF952 domain-containing protein n=1 Tax=Fibrivirga algicola TaxID=2950420 RepID=A0ABX0QH88_9BACT|nr:DUF952 domain-containing protein [Fibrivirga algicola]ARK10263.1 hypothetical protein A6C57_07945 [Fibrella sp. ES10-3-2-2]NID11765.1 DUF952 domain-containing protein [Fibrivirga algicola]
MIYHIVTKADWDRQADQAHYEAASLQSEGFIHLSTKEQVAGVLERYYQNVPDLLLLQVDPNKLVHSLRYEAATNNEHFPHLYGMLNKDAVVTVEKIN